MITCRRSSHFRRGTKPSPGHTLGGSGSPVRSARTTKFVTFSWFATDNGGHVTSTEPSCWTIASHPAGLRAQWVGGIVSVGRGMREQPSGRDRTPPQYERDQGKKGCLGIINGDSGALGPGLKGSSLLQCLFGWSPDGSTAAAAPSRHRRKSDHVTASYELRIWP